MSPVEFGAWRAHFSRFPWDSTDRLLAQLISIQCADPRPTDAEIRPWAYTDRARTAIRERESSEREERAQRALVKLGGGLNWWQE